MRRTSENAAERGHGCAYIPHMPPLGEPALLALKLLLRASAPLVQGGRLPPARGALAKCRDTERKEGRAWTWL